MDGLGDFIILFSSCLLFIVVCGSCMLWMDWNSHSCIGKSCDGWDMGLCYLSSDCTGLEEMVKEFIWQ